MKDVISTGFLLFGSIFFLISALGVLKFPDLFSRMHAASKSSSLAMGLILIGVAVHFFSWGILVKCTLTLLFIFLTAPVAAHILGRAAFLSGAQPWTQLGVQALRDLYRPPAKKEKTAPIRQSFPSSLRDAEL